MRLTAFSLGIIGWVAVVAPAAAQAVSCEAKRQACTAECRAQYFSVDPKRAACAADCTDGSSRCTHDEAGPAIPRETPR